MLFVTFQFEHRMVLLVSESIKMCQSLAPMAQIFNRKRKGLYGRFRESLGSP
jgi:hypothetical protein